LTIDSNTDIVLAEVANVDEYESIKENAIGEITEEVNSLAATIREGVENTNRPMTITELERYWSKTRKSTDGIVSDMVGRLLETANERELVRKKKENTQSSE
jgi:glutamyl-tRNA reductase